MKPSRKIRRAVLAVLLTGSTTMLTGCQSRSGFSLSKLNPFSQASAKPTLGQQSKPTFAAKAKDVLTPSKSRDVAQKSEEDVDPLRLDSKTTVGPEVFVANGRLWESTGNSKKAMESYSQALRAKPNDPDALSAIARLHFREGNHPKAADFFQQAIKAKPSDAGLHNDLGLTMNKIGNKQAAEMSLARALELSPGVSRYANNLASVKFESGDAGGAYKVLAGNNEPAVAHYNMAYLYQKQGNMEKARGHLTESVKFEGAGKVDPSIARAVNRSKELLAQMGSPVQQLPTQNVASAPSQAVPGKVPATAQAPQLPAPTAKPFAAVAQQKMPAASRPGIQVPSTNVRQTSQSTRPGANLDVKPAMGQIPRVQSTPATSAAVKFPRATGSHSTPVNFATARLGVTSKPVAESAPQRPSATVPVAQSNTPASASVSSPVSPQTSAVKPTATTASPSSGSSMPFTLPAGFTMPTQ